MLIASFKNPLQWINERWVLTVPLQVENYDTAWRQVAHYLLNTVLVRVAGCAGMLILSSLAAFVLARMRFPGRDLLYFAIIALLMIPGILSLVPDFMLYKTLGLLNTYWVMIIPTAAGGSVFGVCLLRTFFASLPEELFEAARIDGAGVLGLYWRICIPLSYPILAACRREKLFVVRKGKSTSVVPLMALHRHPCALFLGTTHSLRQTARHAGYHEHRRYVELVRLAHGDGPGRQPASDYRRPLSADAESDQRDDW